MKLGSLVVEFLSDTTGFKKGINEVDSGLDKTESKTKSTTAATASLKSEFILMASAATAVGYAIYATVERYGAMAAEIKDLSLQTGVATQKIQQMQYAAVISNTDFSRVSVGLNQLTLAMSAAKDSTSAQAKAFESLGVSINGKSPEEVFEATTKALVNMKSETARNDVAMTLYGRSWKELLPYMQTYINKTDEIKNSPLYTDAELKDLENAKIAIDKLTNSLTIYVGKAVAATFKTPYFLTALGTNDKSGASSTGSDIGSPMAVTNAVDPFAGLTVKQAEIKNLTDYTIPALQKKLDELKKSGTAKEIADASLELIQAKNNLSTLISEKSEEEKNRISMLTDAYSDYTSAIDKVKNSKQSLADLEDETSANLADAGTDVAAARSVMKAYNKSKLSMSKEYASDVYDVETSAGTFNSLSKGIDPSAVKGTSQYTEAQATAQATQGAIVISGDIYLNGDKSFEKYLSGLRTSMGVPNQ